jgi:hypothetical protein
MPVAVHIFAFVGCRHSGSYPAVAAAVTTAATGATHAVTAAGAGAWCRKLRRLTLFILIIQKAVFNLILILSLQQCQHTASNDSALQHNLVTQKHT